jgi:TetR/AcrR family transcriptional regulator
MPSEWSRFYMHILDLEQAGLATKTFRRLNPERQQVVINAILDEALEKGPASLNIKEVARRAKVSIGSLYTYFIDRRGLLNFTIELCVRSLTDEFNSYRPYLAILPFEDALTTYLQSSLEWNRTQAGLAQFFARAAYRGDAEMAERVVEPVATVMREVVKEILQRAAAKGEIRSDIDLELTARLVNAQIISIADSQLLPYLNNYFQLLPENKTNEQMIDCFISLITRGIQREKD